MTNRSSDDELYEYYNLRGVPARLVFNKQGDLVGSDTFDVEAEELRLSGDLAQILKDPLSDPITEDEFHNLCKELVRRKHQ